VFERLDRPDGSGAPVKLSQRAQVLGILGLSCALSACSGGVLDPAGPISGQERTILFNAMAIMLAIVVPTMIATLVFAWWFRASNTRARYRPDFVYSGRVELIVWSIPIMVVLFLGGVIWIGSHDLDPAKKPASNAPALEVEVVSLDWKWLFIYPQQGVASVNQLVIPAGAPVHFTLTSASVMNTFFVPQLGSMIYTMNGMSTQLWLQADKPGVYHGLSGHYSGDGFSDMNFEVHAATAPEFASWLNLTKGQGQSLDTDAYTALSKQSLAVKPFTYRAVDPALFHDILDQTRAPGPGPDQGRPNAKVTPRLPQDQPHVR